MAVPLTGRTATAALWLSEEAQGLLPHFVKNQVSEKSKHKSHYPVCDVLKMYIFSHAGSQAYSDFHRRRVGLMCQHYSA